MTPRNALQRATQADVARITGVSQTTVSLVLNGTGTAQHRVGEDACQRVLRAIKMTGYTANPVAQRLAGGRTSIIGVYTYESVFPHDAGDFYYPFLEGVENAAERFGVDLLLFTSMSATSGRRLVSSGGVGKLRLADGCVLLGRHSYPEDLAELLRQGFPFAFVGRREAHGARVPYAGAAYDVATQQVVENLLILGHRRIALINDFTAHESTEDRVRGYRTAMARAGLQPVTFDAPQLPLGELLDALRTSQMSAVIGLGVAAPLRRAALERGLSVPGDLSIARLGDPEVPELEDVDWTGFVIPRVQMGAEALHIVMKQLDPLTGDEDLQVRIPCAVVQGSTTARFQSAGRTYAPPMARTTSNERT